MRRVKVRSMKKNGIHETKATTWGELKKELLKEDFITDNMNVLGGDKKMYVDQDTKLPEKDFLLYAVPRKVKSGGSYNELRKEIKHLVDNDSSAKAHFNQGGKNYTNKKRTELERLLGEWNSSKNIVEEPYDVDNASVRNWTIKNDFEAFTEGLSDDISRKDLVEYTMSFLLHHADIETHKEIEDVITKNFGMYKKFFKNTPPQSTDGLKELLFTKEEEETFVKLQSLNF